MRAELKRALCLALALLLLAALTPAAFAEEDAAPLVDTAELDQLIGDFLAEGNLDPERFSLGYVYLETGESYFFNPDTWYDSASLFKLPLMMIVEHGVKTGEIDPVNGDYHFDLDSVEDAVLIRSQNGPANNLFWLTGGFSGYRELSAELAGMTEEQLPAGYTSNRLVSAPYMINLLRELYQNPEEYPRMVDKLKLAQPEEYFRHNLEGQYEIAQKFGSYHANGIGVEHCAGILYMPHPILLVVLTSWLPKGEELIGNAAEMMANYTLELDERLAQRQAEAEAAAAEAQAQAQREAEAQTQAEAETQTAEAAAATPQPAEQPEQAAAQQAQTRTTGYVVLGALLVGLVAVLVSLPGGRRKKKKRSGGKHRS